MRSYLWIATLGVILLGVGRGMSAEPQSLETAGGSLLHRIAPVGGCFPYGGGVLRWWNGQCFPCVGAPDDYCRKPLPSVSWPAYPCYFRWGTPETGSPCPSGVCRPSKSN